MLWHCATIITCSTFSCEHEHVVSGQAARLQASVRRVRAFMVMCTLLYAYVANLAAYGEDGRPRGFAHVSFSDPSAAAAALELNGTEMDGRQVYIDSARERTPGGASGGGRSPSGGRSFLPLPSPDRR